MEVREAARKLKLTVAAIATVINISVFIIWIPARLEINQTWQHINSVWDRIEKVLFLFLDASLNIYFLRRVRHDLIDNGLSKYSTVFWFNVGTVVISITLDVSTTNCPDASLAASPSHAGSEGGSGGLDVTAQQLAVSTPTLPCRLDPLDC